MNLRTLTIRPWAILALLTWLGLTPLAPAQTFQPELDQALEMIDGDLTLPVQPPPDAAELTASPAPAEQPQMLLTEIPGRPFLTVDPPPRALAWWKFPFYAALGAPRDLIDTIAGGFSYVPIISPVIVYPVYELVPTQIFFRDPRDWHRWDANQNRNGHGYYDGQSWGWFSSYNQWEFTYESKGKLRRWEARNEQLRTELNERNRGIEQANQTLARKKREARQETLTAIEAGNGAAATRRIAGYWKAEPLDEGTFALWVTALALYKPQGPEWAGPVLWSDLSAAQPRGLIQARRLMGRILEKYPDRTDLSLALIYTDLLLGETGRALKTGQAALAAKPADAALQRLIFELALADADAARARAAFDALAAAAAPQSSDRAAMEGRLALLEDKPADARRILEPLHAAQPDSPYFDYYMGCVELAEGIADAQGQAHFKTGLELIEHAALQAAHPGLRNRAGKALAYVRGAAGGGEKEENTLLPPKLFE
jgi:hypothetical protein